MFRKVGSEGYHTAALLSQTCLHAVIKPVQVEAFPCLSLNCLYWRTWGSPGHGHGHRLEYGRSHGCRHRHEYGCGHGHGHGHGWEDPLLLCTASVMLETSLTGVLKVYKDAHCCVPARQTPSCSLPLLGIFEFHQGTSSLTSASWCRGPAPSC